MAYVIKDDAVVAQIRTLAALRRQSCIDVLRHVIHQELAQEEKKRSFSEKIRGVQEKVRAMGPPAALDWEEIKHHDDALWGDA